MFLTFPNSKKLPTILFLDRILSSMSWCTIESDPGVFSELLNAYGLPTLEVSELYDLDAESLREKGAKGLFFLFKWRKDDGTEDETAAALHASDEAGDLSGMAVEEQEEPVFLRQVINNACCSIALLNVVLNLPDLPMSEQLEGFKSFVSILPSDARGEALEQAEFIRTAHNSFARAEPFAVETVAAKPDDDVYHFIAYGAVGNSVYEMDGLKPAPRLLGECGPSRGEAGSDGREEWSEEGMHIMHFSSSPLHSFLLPLFPPTPSPPIP